MPAPMGEGETGDAVCWRLKVPGNAGVGGDPAVTTEGVESEPLLLGTFTLVTTEGIRGFGATGGGAGAATLVVVDVTGDAPAGVVVEVVEVGEVGAGDGGDTGATGVVIVHGQLVIVSVVGEVTV